MKTVRAIVTTLIWTLAGCYLLPAILLHIPAIQEMVGEKVAEVVAETLKTNVRVGRVDVGFFNRLVVDGLRIDDQQRQPMIQASRVAAKVDLVSLFQGKVRISSAQLFGLDARLYQKDAHTPPNFQFALDALSDKDNKEPSHIDLAIQSLVVRNGSVRYDQLWQPRKAGLSPSHLHLSQLSGHFVLHSLTPDGLKADIKKLSFCEQSGLQVDALSLHFKADQRQARISDLSLRLPHSLLVVPEVAVSYRMAEGSIDWRTAQGRACIASSHVTVSDLAFLQPGLKDCDRLVSLELEARMAASQLQMSGLRLQSEGLLDTRLTGRVSLKNPANDWQVNIVRLSADLPQLSSLLAQLTQGNTKLPAEVARLGHVNWTGSFAQLHGRMEAKGRLLSDAGFVRLNAALRGREVSGMVETEGFELGRLLGNPDLGGLAAKVEGRALIPQELSQLRFEAKVSVPYFDFKGYRYRQIHLDGAMANDVFDGLLSLDDSNGRIRFQGKVAHLLSLLEKRKQTSVAVDASLTVDNASLSRLQLSDALGARVLSLAARIQGNASSLDDLNGLLELKNFSLRQPGEQIVLPYLHAEVVNGVAHRSLRAHTDFADIEIGGRYDYPTLLGRLQNLVGHYLPSLVSPVPSRGNDCVSISATISDTPLLRSLLHLPLTLQAPVELQGVVDGRHGNLQLTAPSLTVSDQQITQATLHLQTADSLHLTFAAHREDKEGTALCVSGYAAAKDDQLRPHIAAQMGGKLPVSAEADANVAFERDRGMLVSRIHLNPSMVKVDTLLFNVLASDITYAHHRLDIDHFEVSNKEQLIGINGQTTGSEDDSLKVTLRNIDVPYILDLVHFKSVEFDGVASGTAYVKKFFTQPTINAQLQVDGFQFEKGDMGTLRAHVTVQDGRVNIDAVADDGPDSHTDIKGYVSIKDNYINLPIRAYNSRLDFVQSFTDSFLDDVHLRGNGWVRVIGPLSDVNLAGNMRASGSVHVSALNTDYHVRDVQVLLRPDEITFMNDTIRDREGNYGILSGGLHHQALRRLTYDIFLEAHNMLAYDNPQPDLKISFWGRVYATGACAIHGRSGETTMDIEATPGPRSFIEYNAAQEGTVGGNDFIEWLTPRADSVQTVLQGGGEWEAARDSLDKEIDVPSDMRINFLVKTNPDFTLRVLMDAASGDNIALRGNGVIRANWFNKGAFQMYGNYDVDEGSYNITIQNIIKRSFQFQPGSSIAFGGDPFAAALNLKARYTLNSVPLSDLQLGQSFKRNNIRVNCLMDINGTPESPQVTFGLDLPTLSADAQQMVRSVINSQEDMNQQVLYLLAVGRFYTQGANNALQEQQAQSQTSLAMQSLLSGTLSQQINSVLSNVVRSDNWSFGANISTGDEGFNNAEYEGLLNGRLLNNRLLINGEFGYRDNAATDNASFIGDFDIRYLFTPTGSLAVRFYNQNNDRYFTRNSLTTQGIGLIIKKDFTNLRDLFGPKRKKWGIKKEKRPKARSKK